MADDWTDEQWMGQLAEQDTYVPDGFGGMQLVEKQMPRKPVWPDPPELPPDDPPNLYDVNERAAQRLRQSVIVPEGRKEYPGQILRPPVDFLAHGLENVNRMGQTFVGGAERYSSQQFPEQARQRTGEDPTISTEDEPVKQAISGELPLLANLWGLSSVAAKPGEVVFSANRASRGGAAAMAAPAIIKQQHIPPSITKVDPAMFEEGLSNVKQRIPLSELDAGRTFKSKAAPVAKSEPADLPIGSTVLSLHGDRSALGELARVEGEPVGKGHKIGGGADFIQTHSPEVWASDTGISSGYQNRIGDLMSTTGQNVYGLYGPMGIRNIDFQPAVSKLALQGVRDVRGKLSDEAIDLFNYNMRRQWGGPTPLKPDKKPDWRAVPDWPGITKTTRAEKFLANASGGTRNKFGNMLDRAEMMDAGMPNMSAIRHGFTSPEMANLPNYTYGRRVAQLSPDPAIGKVVHPAFDKNIAGQALGGWGFASPREVAFEDVVKGLQRIGQPPSRWDYYFQGLMPKQVPYRQEVTQRWVDANSAFGQNAAKMGELAALDDFSKRGLFFTGATDKKTGAAALVAANMPEINPPFFSAAQRAVDNAKMTKGSAEQWLGYLRNQPGVKQEELDWMFGGLGKGPVTKAQMQEHAAKNAMQLGEVIKGGEGFDAGKVASLRGQRTDIIDERRRTSRMLDDAHMQFATDPSRREALRDEIDGLKNRMEELQYKHQAVDYELEKAQGDPTKYSKWQLEGGENYRELLLTLPQRRLEATDAAIAKAGTMKRKQADMMSEWKTLAEARPPGDPETLAAYQRLVAHRKEADAAQEEANTIINKYRDEQFKSSHWDEPNVLAHIRSSDREIPPQAGGRNQPLKTLHVEEIQSDLHQAGRTEGYRNPNPSYTLEGNGPWVIRDDSGRMVSDWNNKDKAIKHVERLNSGEIIEAHRPGVPDLPFKNTWADVSLKRMIREAAEKGYDAISWTPGETQAARYSLEAHLKELQYHKNPDGTFSIGGVRKDGEGFNHHESLTPEKLPGVVGKEMAEKIINNEGKRARGHPENMGYFDGVDLKIGGEGMRGFYDKMLIDKANAIAKKHGATVEQTNLPRPRGEANDQYRRLKDVTKPDEIATEQYKQQWDELVADKIAIREQNADPNAKMSPLYRQAGLARINQIEGELDKLHSKMVEETVDRIVQATPGPPVHLLRITDKLREAALKGFPLFTAGGAVVGGGVMGELARQGGDSEINQ